MRLRSLVPMLQSSDLQRTIDWYSSVLGFRCIGREEEWCRLERDGVTLMFMRNAHLGAPQFFWIYFFKDQAPEANLLAFSLATHFIFMIMNASLALPFLPRASRELMGAARS